MTKNKTITLLAIIALLIPLLTIAADTSPFGDFSGLGIFKIYNFTNITADKFCLNNNAPDCISSWPSGGSGGGNTTEEIQDAVGKGFTNGLVYNDTANQFYFNTTYGANYYLLKSQEPTLNVNSSTYVNASGVLNEYWYNTLAELQTAVSNDFHNLGGTDDDNPEPGEVDWSDLTDQGTFTDAKWCSYSSTTGYITCTVNPVTDTDTTCDGNTCNIANTGTLDGYEATDLLDNTDSQTLSYNPTTDEISISGGNTIDITEVDTQLSESQVENYVFDSDNAGNLITTGQVNASDLCITGGICLSEAGTGSGDITEVNTPGKYLYGGSTSGAVTLHLNETELNNTIDARQPFGSSIDDTELTAESFGDFSCTGAEDGCTINAGVISDNEVNALSWSKLNNYPSACSSSQTITALGDTLTCTAISITESQISDFAISSADITDNTIQEADLKVVDTPSDEDILTYEVTGGDFEWHSGSELCTAITGSADLCDGSDADTQLTQEQVEDYTGAMVSGNTETGITVTYDDLNGKLDFAVTDNYVDTTGDTMTGNLAMSNKNVTGVQCITFNSGGSICST
ncbi:hypothetical protein D6783_03890 [Candidatus Woesearchaeota archaeon]|nr:MAG: hypothetical protein D6783_03890 [Candidatus Woesearchaeota archaeon]